MEETKPAAPNPIMDVVAPPPPDPSDRPAPHAAAPPAHKKAPPAKPPKPRGNGVAGVIVATVVIMLGLAALAVYAYLKQGG